MKKNTLVTGLALFAMFFGAGNLIFPPFLGMESGTDWVIGFLCFILIDVALSCLGIFALNAAGGANVAVEGSLGKVPGLVLNTAVILCTGMIIAEPRTAATTYEMSIVPLFGDSVNMLLFSALFFAVVLALSIRQTRLVQHHRKGAHPAVGHLRVRHHRGRRGASAWRDRGAAFQPCCAGRHPGRLSSYGRACLRGLRHRHGERRAHRRLYASRGPA